MGLIRLFLIDLIDKKNFKYLGFDSVLTSLFPIPTSSFSHPR